MENGKNLIYLYWGKSQKDSQKELRYHLLVYHSLDATAVAEYWLETSPVLRRLLTKNSEAVKAWLLFFIALHDIGKFDIRFQLKVKEIRNQIYPLSEASGLMPIHSFKYDHGAIGLAHLYKAYMSLFDIEEDDDSFTTFFDDPDEGSWDLWAPWAEAVCGHHGRIVHTGFAGDSSLPMTVPESFSEYDGQARIDWIKTLSELFLSPYGLTYESQPPEMGKEQAVFAGFCSICDWLGSALPVEEYRKEVLFLDSYYMQVKQNFAPEILRNSGLMGQRKSYRGIEKLLKKGSKPLQLQTVVDDIEFSSGLYIVEGPTGSGKTETALGLAWKMMEKDLGESIVFALPTQATANAMFDRMEILAKRLFEKGPNLILAHGNSSYNKEFLKLIQNSEEINEGLIQCTRWLSQSRKRAFLGQLGISTVDQVLTSVLPVRHRFIRGFGLGRSILIVDEIHAYDTYMYGLLSEVIKVQKAVGGVVILLSATLPERQRQRLVSAWNPGLPLSEITPTDPYPVITQVTDGLIRRYVPSIDQLPPKREINFETRKSPSISIGIEIIEEILHVAEAGSNVVVVCNTVGEAQKVYESLKSKSSVTILLFHSRFTLHHRQEIEDTLLEKYGPDASVGTGSIVVATQVVEQSLDLDFDWMVSQLCPCDLLFQRIGRIQRHANKDSHRIKADTASDCCVVVPENPEDRKDYGATSIIYENFRVLHRTMQLLENQTEALVFPHAYRSWIEAVYSEEAWENEEEVLQLAYEEYIYNIEFPHDSEAQQMITAVNTMQPFGDDDVKIQALTRSSDFGISLLPYLEDAGKKVLLDGTYLQEGEKEGYEVVAMNKVSAPKSWGKYFTSFLCTQEGPLEGVYTLPMKKSEEGKWKIEQGNTLFTYTKEKGLEKSPL